MTCAESHSSLLAAWIRGQWRIENFLHWVRDETFGKDASQVRVGFGPQVLSALANLAISALRLAGADNIAAGRLGMLGIRCWCWSPTG